LTSNQLSSLVCPGQIKTEEPETELIERCRVSKSALQSKDIIIPQDDAKAFLMLSP